MRPIVVGLVALAAGPTVAATPSCALPGRLAANPPSSPASAPLPVLPAKPPTAPTPADLSLPFVRHVSAAGAVVSDLGMMHGLRSIAARNGDQFMLFEVTPDGLAAVSGVMAELTPQALTAIARGNVTPLGPMHGLAGMFVRSGPQFQVFYVTPDGQRVIPGAMWDAAGKNLTRDQVAAVPGAIPTVEVGDVGAAKAAGAPAAAPAQPALPLLEKAAFGTVGSTTAPHLWMLMDPRCIYSVRAMQMLQPYVQAGQVQLSVVPLSVLDYEDHGDSTRAALALLGKPAAEIVPAWQSGMLDGPVRPGADQLLRVNMAVAGAIHLKGTPVFVWRKSDGTEGRIDGLPSSVQALVAAVGS